MRRGVLFCLLCAANVAVASVAQAQDNCSTLYQYFADYDAAQQAENNFDYFGQRDDALTNYNRCIGFVRYSSYPDQAARECEEDYNDRLNEIESDYTPIHNEVIATGQTYLNYKSYLDSQNEYCPT